MYAELGNARVLSTKLQETNENAKQIGDIALRLVTSASYRRIELQMEMLTQQEANLKSAFEALPKMKSEIAELQHTSAQNPELAW